MPRYIAFLRGINLGKRRLTMSRLARIFEEIGHTDVKTFIASGNILFESRMRNTAAIEAKASQQLQSSLGYEVDVFIRTAEALVEIARSKPFPDEKTEDLRIHVAFLHQPLPAELKRKLEAIRTATDEFKADQREYYWLCRTRTSESKVWTLPEMRALRLPPATMRNMTTIQRLTTQHLQ